MKKMARVVFCLFLGTTGILSAADKIWTGGGNDFKWSTAANWNGTTIPANNDMLYFTLSAIQTLTNDLTGLSLSGLVITNSAQVKFSGNAFSIGGKIEIQANASVELATGFTTTSDLTLISNNKSNTISGPISGSQTITRSGTSPLYLAGNNGNFAGSWILTNGYTYVRSTTALGPTAPITIYGNTNASTCALLYATPGCYTNNVILYRGSDSLIFANASVTNYGSITSYGQTRMNANDYTLAWAGGMYSTNGGFIFNSTGVGRQRIINTPIDIATATLYFDAGNLDLEIGGKWGITLVVKGTVSCFAPYVLSTNGPIQVGTGYGNWGTLDLRGNDQRAKGLFSSYNANTGTIQQIVTSARPATLELTHTSANDYYGFLNGAVSILMNGAGGTFTIKKEICPTTGSLIASAGRIIVDAAAQFPAITSLVVTNTGRITVNTDKINPGMARIVQAQSGILELASGVTLMVSDAKVGNSYLPSGSYTSASQSFIQGAGTLVVLRDSAPEPQANAFIWTGAAGDRQLTTANNWLGSTAPQLTIGDERLIFSVGTALAEIGNTVRVNSILINTNSTFTLTATNDVANLILFDGGILASNPTPTTTRTHVLNTPITCYAPRQAITVDTNITLALTNRLTGGHPTWIVVKDSPGILRLYGSNDFTSVLLVSNGSLRVHHNQALGATNRPVYVLGGPSSATPTPLRFESSVTNDVPLMLSRFIGDITAGGTKNYFNAPIHSRTYDLSATGSESTHLRFSGMTTLRGGLLAVNRAFWIQVYTGSSLLIEQNPLISTNFSFSQDDGGTLRLATTNNAWGQYYIYGGTLQCEAAGALPTNSIIQIGVNWKTFGTLDLNGYDQKLTMFRTGDNTTNANHEIVTSTNGPAMLTLLGNSINFFSGQFTGKAGLHHAGPGTFIFTNDISTTEGLLRVSQGTVRFSAGSGWINSTNIIVDNVGQLIVDASVASTVFGPAVNTSPTWLHLNDTGVIQLPTNTVTVVRGLYINGVPKPIGTYGNTGSGATTIDTVHFAGTGLLQTLNSAIPGSVLMLR